jgi:hypothetical protein
LTVFAPICLDKKNILTIITLAPEAGLKNKILPRSVFAGYANELAYFSDFASSEPSCVHMDEKYCWVVNCPRSFMQMKAGADFMITIFGEKIGVFLQYQCYDQLFSKFSFVLSQKRQLFSQKISAKIFLKS